MRFLLAILIALSLSPIAAQADTIDQLANRSEFVRINAKYLLSKKVVSVYAGTKSYCPSSYWWSARVSSDRNALSGYNSTINREMKQAGFPAASIKHCVENSGFVIKGATLQNHPKNKSYRRSVQSGVMVFSSKGGAAKTIPVLVETNTFGARNWAVYDASFKKICTVTDGSPGVNLSCSGMGRTKGTATREGGRSTFTSTGNGPKIMVMTGRAPSYVKRVFDKAF